MAPKLVSFVGRSGSGKTSLIVRLIPYFTDAGLRVGTIKHTHHDVQFDKPGKDSWKHQQAGSSQVLLLTDEKLAIFRQQKEPDSLQTLAEKWFQDFDLIISEGFKNDDVLKIEVTRFENHKPPLFKEDHFQIQALVADYQVRTSLPVFSFDALDDIFQWICQKLCISS